MGNILDEKDFWKNFSDDHGSLRLNYIGNFHETIGRKFNGYSPSELLRIEAAFLEGCGYELPLTHLGIKPTHPTHPDVLFNGLLQAIKVLCELEGIKSIMHLTESFHELRVKKEFNLVEA